MICLEYVTVWQINNKLLSLLLMRTGTLGTFKVLLFRISGRTEQERTFTLFLSSL